MVNAVGQSSPALEDVVEACRRLRTAQLELARAIERTDQVLLDWLRASRMAPAVASRTARAALLDAGWSPEDLAHAGVDETGVLARRPF